MQTLAKTMSPSLYLWRNAWRRLTRPKKNGDTSFIRASWRCKYQFSQCKNHPSPKTPNGISFYKHLISPYLHLASRSTLKNFQLDCRQFSSNEFVVDESICRDENKMRRIRASALVLLRSIVHEPILGLPSTLLIGMWISLTKKPTKPMMRNPNAVACAMPINSFMLGFWQRFRNCVPSRAYSWGRAERFENWSLMMNASSWCICGFCEQEHDDKVRFVARGFTIILVANVTRRCSKQGF